ncbi:MAG TPA: T9SS type A sorting domain-containing protein [Bacteroidia bacterium]|nr:T9SS type A sorting domain-containing protein [Bacteroidia bacterium]HRS57732.1 T9SS type A sorting domain-containing protein [Bacteroidia bacterium]HRU67053.1 T9SS type A sorting domain-containing protein [Bacteroidia bacterium]
MKMKNVYLLFLITFLCFGLSFKLSAQKIAAGGWHTVVVCQDGTVKAFGENASGQLGNGDNTDSNVPVSTGLTDVIAVSAGGDQLEAHSMALKNDGTVWAWGSNLYGQLGNASTTNTNVPVQTLLLSNVKEIAAGGWHSVALKNDGTVWTWGWNMDGQLGDGITTDRIIPGQVPGLTDIVQIAAGTYHTLALKSDGTVWAWGDNVSGQIGNGTTGTDVTSPVKVSGLTNVVKIDAGRFFSIAVKSDGSVWTWGENLYGQLGDSTTTDRNVPGQVVGITAKLPVIMAAGAFHCMIVKSDGTVWAWGRNTYGNLGDNTVTHRLLPVQMIDISDVAGMDAGTNFSIIYKNDGTFWACGRNASGQLGDGTFTQRNLLTQSSGVCPILSDIHEFPEPEEVNLKTFPNPSENGIFELNFSGDDQNFTNINIEVYDMMGHQVLNKQIHSENNHHPVIIDLSGQSSGIYLLKMGTGNSFYSVKLIKR